MRMVQREKGGEKRPTEAGSQPGMAERGAGR